VDYGKYLHCAGNLDTEYTRLIARSGPLAFTACFVQSGTGIQVIDINPKDPSGPQVLSTLPLGTSNMASCIAASGRYAFVVEGHGYCQGGDLIIIDAADPGHPQIVGGLPIPGDASDIAICGTCAIVAEACLFDGVQIVDFSVPSSPQVLAQVTTGGSADGVAVSGSYLYISVHDWHYPYPSSLAVVDISDPRNPWTVSNVSMNVSGQVIVSGHYAFVNGLQVIDIIDPRNPRVVGGIEANGPYMSLSGTRLCQSGNGQFQVIDVSDPPNPRLLGRIDAGVGGANVADGSRAYVTHGDVMIVDMDNPNNPPELGRVEVPGIGFPLAASGDYAFSAGLEGLKVIDFSDPASPYLVTEVITPQRPASLSLAGSLAYIAAYNPLHWGPPGSLSVIDLGDPRNPLLIGGLDMTMECGGIVVDGTHAYVLGRTDSAYRLSVVDIQDPHVPWIAGDLDFSDVTYGLAVSGDYAYVTVRTVDYPYVYGLRIVRISDPGHPMVVAAIDSVFGYSAFIRGNNLYLVSGGLSVFDISDPVHPQLIGTLDTPGEMGTPAMAFDEPYAYWSKRTCFHVIDLADPRSPRLIGSEAGGGGGIATSGNLVLSVTDASFRVNPAQCDRDFAIHRSALRETGPMELASTLRLYAVPNPTSGLTAVRFALKEPGPVQAGIHDPTGRLVCRLYNGNLGIGWHDLRWNGLDETGRPVPQGSYFVRVWLPGEARSAPITLIR